MSKDRTMFDRWKTVGLAALLSFVALAGLRAQDDGVVRPFAEVNAERESLDSSLDDVVNQYRTATATEKLELVKQYEVLATKSRALLPELRSAAVTAYEAAPNVDPKITTVLVGLLANDVRIDRYAAALELGNLLLKHKCDEPALDGLIGAAAYCLDDFETAAVHLTKADDANTISPEAIAYFEDLEEAKLAWAREQALRKSESAADDLPRVKLQTSKGDVVIELYENEAPQAVGNFVSLVEKKYYDGLTFHRVLPGFMAQGGCPDGTGGGGPGYNIYCECEQENHRNHFRGTLSMAHAGRDTSGSQFFLTFVPTPHLDGKHTAFGRVIEGIDVLAELNRVEPGAALPADTIVEAKVLRKRDHDYSNFKKLESRR